MERPNKGGRDLAMVGGEPNELAVNSTYSTFLDAQPSSSLPVYDLVTSFFKCSSSDV